MKAIIAAGGDATRVRPAQDKSQQIVYDKPVLYYLLTNAMKAQIRDVMIVCNERNVAAAEALFRDAEWEFGVNVKFATIAVPNGPAGVFRLPQVRRHIGTEPVCLILDGIYHGGNFDEVVRSCAKITSGATVLAARTSDPRPYGWINTDANGDAIEIVEKPGFVPEPDRSYLVQTHMYFYGPEVIYLASQLLPSDRNQYEVTDLHTRFLSQQSLDIKILEDRGCPLLWDDAGTARKLLALAIAVRGIQEDGNARTLVGSPHLQALRNGWVTSRQIRELCSPFLKRGIEYYDALSAEVTKIGGEIG
ncbi:MAG: hypothetical protein HY270_00435 [Deltaproteobacteria bacterium]|nr:hypothetical protein [Deltaproteobacteria bacterium]